VCDSEWIVRTSWRAWSAYAATPAGHTRDCPEHYTPVGLEECKVLAAKPAGSWGGVVDDANKPRGCLEAQEAGAQEDYTYTYNTHGAGRLYAAAVKVQEVGRAVCKHASCPVPSAAWVAGTSSQPAAWQPAEGGGGAVLFYARDATLHGVDSETGATVMTQTFPPFPEGAHGGPGTGACTCTWHVRQSHWQGGEMYHLAFLVALSGPGLGEHLQFYRKMPFSALRHFVASTAATYMVTMAGGAVRLAC